MIRTSDSAHQMGYSDMFKRIARQAAILLTFAFAACGGGGSGPTPHIEPPQTGTALLTTFVGVGDSLTAGYQSDGFLGALNVTNPVSAYPGNIVPPGQENGWWALFYVQAKGVS
ncbi:MAG: hypothetical protein M3R35_04255, partial [Candidatus Eremiobacteraeota bacterium]|nr:hypothetical protein [Candidatus Eremiobacteraeota bacterium]